MRPHQPTVESYNRARPSCLQGIDMKDGQIPSWEDIETHDTQMRISRAASSTTVKSGSSTVTQEDEELGKLRDGTRTKLQLVRRCCDSCLAPATRLGRPVRLRARA